MSYRTSNTTHSRWRQESQRKCNDDFCGKLVSAYDSMVRGILSFERLLNKFNPENKVQLINIIGKISDVAEYVGSVSTLLELSDENLDLVGSDYSQIKSLEADYRAAKDYYDELGIRFGKLLGLPEDINSDEED